MVPIQRTLQKYSAGSNIFWELGYQDTPLFPGLILIPIIVWGDTLSFLLLCSIPMFLVLHHQLSQSTVPVYLAPSFGSNISWMRGTVLDMIPMTIPKPLVLPVVKWTVLLTCLPLSRPSPCRPSSHCRRCCWTGGRLWWFCAGGGCSPQLFHPSLYTQ